MDPRRKSTTAETPGKRPTRNSAGRWSLLSEELHAAPTVIEQARRTDAALESFARQLLARYGVLFRDLLTRESNAPKWRDLLNILRRLEARGEIRGGRFVSGFSGEQYALPEAMESLRAARTRECPTIIPVSAADPMNLAGIVIPGDRIPAVPGKQALYSNGTLHSESEPATIPAEKLAAALPLTHLPESIPTPLGLF
jgi:ATP-dependent Lhr-like helicase